MFEHLDCREIDYLLEKFPILVQENNHHIFLEFMFKNLEFEDIDFFLEKYPDLMNVSQDILNCIFYKLSGSNEYFDTVQKLIMKMYEIV